ncbi:MAG: hypothetical protein J0H02_14550 [Armatimonadetes bacterium]|nr:hypothetical protein [Armatimonadota bacterium]
MKIGFKLPLAMATLALAGAASASVTALTVIPIADILKHREAVVGYGLTGNERNIDKGYSHYAWTTIGIGDGVEVAYGHDLQSGGVLSGTSYTLHIKAQLYEGKNSALSIGASNYTGDGLKCDTFAVGRYDLPFCRLHVGYMHDDEHRMIFGTDFALFGDCTGMLEWISGPHANGWVGFNMPIKQVPGLNLQLGVGVPADRKDGYQHTAIVWYGFKF